MLKLHISKRTCGIVVHIFLLIYSSYTFAQFENIISVQEIRPDKACGPRCLWALMQITKEGKSDYGIKNIYKLIGKEPFSITNMKDLHDAAEQLGFSAKGYKLTIDRLAKNDGYAILPIGSATGTAEDPLHFILIKRIIKDYVIVVNTKNLNSQALLISDLTDYWNGYALIITTGKGMKLLRKEPDDIKQLPKKIKTAKYDQIKDFGQVESGSIVEHTFTISNDKGKDSKVKIVQKNCTCLKAKLGKDIEGRHTLTMELHVDSPAWQQAHAIVLLEPGGVIKRYAVKAYGTDTFQIWPYIAHIEAPDGGLIEYPVKINYYTGSDDIVKFDRMESSIANLKCGPVKSGNSTKEGATTFTFEIPLLFNAGEPSRVENINGGVDFILDTGKGQRHIPLELTAKVGTEKFKLIPEKVFLMPSKSNGSLIQKKVKLDFLTEAVPKNITVRSDSSVPYKVTTRKESEKSFMICISPVKEKLQNLSSGMHKSELVIVPEGVSELNPIKLPVSMFVRE